MGIINATPDSFYEHHLQKGLTETIDFAEKMIKEGASILDVGGQSTRPGSIRISAAEEIDRTIPVIENLIKKYPELILSIDTYHHKVAEAAVNAGAVIVNDVSAGNMDKLMLETVAKLQVPYICMHMKGTPENRQSLANYDDVVTEVLDYFIKKISDCEKAGIKDILIDPGFGFAKNAVHNFTLLKNLSAFKMLDKPILVGLSRKATIYKTLGITSGEALNGTTVLNTLSLLNGAAILRVHDVKEAQEAVILMESYKA